MCSYHAFGALLSPYNALLSSQTFVSFSNLSVSGGYTYGFPIKYACKNAYGTFGNLIWQFPICANVKQILTDSALGVGEYVSSIFSLIPCTINLALNLGFASASGQFS